MSEYLDTNVAKVKRKRATAAKPKGGGQKTLTAALVACALAGVDLYMTLRYGLKLF